MASIDLVNISHLGAREVMVLDDVTAHVPDGASLAVVGPQEAGTSLLLRLVVGLEEPTSGQVLLGGEPVDDASPRMREVSMMFQDFENYPHLDVFDNLAFSARLVKGHFRDDVAERVHEVAKLLGIEHLLDTKPAKLAEPQRQLVALGRTLVRDARAYLLDNPFSTLDERSRSQVRSTVIQWQKTLGRTTVYVTDDVLEALSIGDEVAVMHQGRLRQIAAPRDLYEFPLDVLVAGFIGSPPMNLVPAHLDGDQLRLPFLSLPLSPYMAERLAGRDLLLAGVRPEDCLDATHTSPANDSTVAFTADVDQIEWRGHEQYAYLGFELDEDAEARLEALEDLLEFDLFHSHLVAAIRPDSALRPGMSMQLALDSGKIHIFDPQTGENLTLADPD